MILTLLAAVVATLAACAPTAFAAPTPQVVVDGPEHFADGDRLARAVAGARAGMLGAGMLAAPLPTAWCGVETTADDTANAAFAPGLPQFKVIYAHPADRPDRFDTWKNLLQANASQILQFVSSQPGSQRAPRFDLGTPCGPQYLDIQTVALPGTRAGYIDNFSGLRAAVAARVNPAPGGVRDYVILADTLGSAVHRIGQLYLSSTGVDRPDAANIHNNGGLYAALWMNDTTPSSASTGWQSMMMLLHEMSHMMGAVQWAAPHSSQIPGGPTQGTLGSYSHCWDGVDVMCYQDGPSMSRSYMTMVCSTQAPFGTLTYPYDCGGDDYFNPAPPAGTYLASHWNVYDSVFMAGCASQQPGACLASSPRGAPVNVGAPGLAGTATRGQVLSATPGTWTPQPDSLSYRWEHDTSQSAANPIAGATSSTYTPSIADVGRRIRVRVTATNALGSTVAYTRVVGPVSAAAPVNTTAPVLDGAARRGGRLTVTNGQWSDPSAPIAYAWQRDAGSGSGFTAIAGATANSYSPAAADVGARIRAVVSARNAEGTGQAESNALGPVLADPPVNTTAPQVTGTPVRAQRLTATAGAWTGAGNAYAYTWQRRTAAGGDFAGIPAANALTYFPTLADIGASVRARVTATNPEASVAAYSQAVAIVADAPVSTAVPQVGGTPARGERLFATTGAWTGGGNAYSYR